MLGIAGLLVLVAVPLAFIPDPALRLTPSEAAPNQVVTVTGSGFGSCLPDATDSPGEGLVIDPRTYAAVTWDDGRRLGDAPLDDGGGFTTSITVPADATPGGHLVTATCWLSSTSDQVSEPELLTVLAPPPPTTSPQPTTTRPRPTTATRPPTTAGALAAQPTTAPPTSQSDEIPSATVERTGFQAPLVWLAVLVVLAILLWLGVARAVRQRRRGEPDREPPNPVVTAAVVPGAPPSLDVRPLGRERTVALSVVVRIDPGELTVSGRGER